MHLHTYDYQVRSQQADFKFETEAFLTGVQPNVMDKKPQEEVDLPNPFKNTQNTENKTVVRIVQTAMQHAQNTVTHPSAR